MLCGFTMLPLDPFIASMVLNGRQARTTGPRSAVGNVSGCRYVADCRSRGREFDSQACARKNVW